MRGVAVRETTVRLPNTLAGRAARSISPVTRPSVSFAAKTSRQPWAGWKVLVNCESYPFAPPLASPHLFLPLFRTSSVPRSLNPLRRVEAPPSVSTTTTTTFASVTSLLRTVELPVGEVDGAATRVREAQLGALLVRRAVAHHRAGDRVAARRHIPALSG